MKRLLAVVILGLAALGAASLGVTISDRKPPIVFDDARALASKAVQGGELEVQFTVHRLRVCDLESKRWLTDAQGKIHAISTYTRGEPSDAWAETYKRSITIPEGAAPGPASYTIDLSYSCNVFHRLGWPIHVSSPPIRFEILRKD